VQHNSACRRGFELRLAVALVPIVVGAASFGVARAEPGTATSGSVPPPTAAPPPSPPPLEDRPSRRSTTARAPFIYADMIRRWHTPPNDGPELTPEGRPLLVLEILNTEERYEFAPTRDDGGWSDEDLERASQALRDPRNGQKKPVDGRVLDLAYRVELHFQAKALRVVSGYRRGISNHAKGRAMDIVVPGARDDEVARFARTFGFVGVGLYPRSGFVHLDTRPRSYFWVDSSGPGQKSRSSQVFAKIGEDSDAKAAERGEGPPGSNGEGEGTTAGDESEGSSKSDEGKAKRSR